MQIFMFRNTMVKWLSFVFGAFLSIGWFLPADVEAYGESKQLRLPRSFEGARLGMTRRQLPVAGSRGRQAVKDKSPCDQHRYRFGKWESLCESH
jgi:hypothetical protein